MMESAASAASSSTLQPPPATSFSTGGPASTASVATGSASTGAAVPAGASPAGGRLLSTFEPYSSFLHQSRGAPIAATAFHPHRMMIAGTALGDSHINIYACRKSPDVD